MDIQTHLEGTVVVIKLTGRMSLDQLPLLSQEVQSHMEEGKLYFVFNMLDVTDISSTGIGRILGIYKELELKHGKLALAELSPVCEYVLDLARLTDIFPTYKSEIEGVLALKELELDTLDQGE